MVTFIFPYTFTKLGSMFYKMWLSSKSVLVILKKYWDNDASTQYSRSQFAGKCLYDACLKYEMK